MNRKKDGADVFADHTMRTILIGQNSRPRSPEGQQIETGLLKGWHVPSLKCGTLSPR
ncbi:hypothetical protein ASPFODRAFT_44573 [Aspergillus luchuensis CBS 106.47]|uniref:Uncharacterized protein n=1 Tax=Aspergillus luchuensis (strain CBS 106.47) TaxID=1137211 RepID=A0A1M3TPY6_ASPLC|nr:hypothetical protein ASPFODRAFT_44573 [Aspergillus luchuensis CBS 106.47]